MASGFGSRTHISRFGVRRCSLVEAAQHAVCLGEEQACAVNVPKAVVWARRD